MSLYKPKVVYAASERNTLQQLKEFKYIGVVFTSDGRWSEEADGWIAKANAVLHDLYCSVVTKPEVSSTTKLLVFKSVFVPILTCDPESWVVTEIILSQGRQAAEMGFLRKAHDVTLRDKVRSCKIRRALNVEPLLRIGRAQIYWFGHVSRMPHERLARHVQLAKPTEKRFRGHPRPRWSNYISDLAWSRIGVEPPELSEIAVDRVVLQVFLGL